MEERRANLTGPKEPRLYEIEEYYENIPSGLYTCVEIERLDIRVSEVREEKGKGRTEVGADYDFETVDGKKGVIYISEGLKNKQKAVYDMIMYFKYYEGNKLHTYEKKPEPVKLYGLTLAKPKGSMNGDQYSFGVGGVGDAYIMGSIVHETQYPTTIPDYDIVNKSAPILLIGFFLFGMPFISFFRKWRKF